MSEKAIKGLQMARDEPFGFTKGRHSMEEIFTLRIVVKTYTKTRVASEVLMDFDIRPLTQLMRMN